MWGMIALTAIVLLAAVVLEVKKIDSGILWLVVLCLVIGSCNMIDPQPTISVYECEEKQ